MKDPEYIRLITAASTLWVLRFAQDDKLYFQLQYLSIRYRIGTLTNPANAVAFQYT